MATADGVTDAVEDVDGGRRERERRVQARVDYNPGGRRAGMRRGQKRWRAGEAEEVRTGAKRKQTVLTPAHVAVSPLTVTRMVGGRYDWLDGVGTRTPTGRCTIGKRAEMGHIRKNLLPVERFSQFLLPRCYLAPFSNAHLFGFLVS